VEAELKKGDVALIIEPIQGVGGLDQGTTEFFKP
jgi:acetylornithine aminotransferase